MATFLISFFTVVLVLTSLFLILLVLMQRGSEGGTALGGGAAESAFGGQTNAVLTRATVISAIIFFVVGLGLYLGQIGVHRAASEKVELQSAISQAQERSAAAAAAATPTTAPKLGEATAEAEKLLATEAQSEPEDIATQPSAPEVETSLLPFTLPAETAEPFTPQN